MKVKELIKVLKLANPEARIVMARDEEGNGFHNVWKAEDFDTTFLMWPNDEEFILQDLYEKTTKSV